MRERKGAVNQAVGPVADLPGFSAWNGVRLEKIEGKRWVVLCTLSRQEKVLARACHGKGIPFYLPLYQSRRIYGKRRVVFHLPLFPGYLFCAVDRLSKLYLQKTNKVFKILEVFDQEVLLEDLCQIKSAQESGADLRPNDRVPVKGEKVVVIHGPFEGYSGIVERGKGQTRLIITIQAINRSFSIEIERSLAVPLREHNRSAGALAGRA